MNKTRIDWADYTWNPVVGCTGFCPYCYARKMAMRFHRDFSPHWVQSNFERPMPKKAARIFVNSMSDVADWRREWAERVESKMANHPEHLFLFLTKRPWLCEKIPCPSMLGYSVTRQADLDLLIGGRRWGVEFLSIEPLLGPVQFWPSWTPRWIIVGAETGNRREKVRPDPSWLLDIFCYAGNHGIPVFFKESLRSIWPAGEGDYFPQEYPSIQ